ncbi:hypothetical protein BDA96_03G437800 [Sorghum bicolor]|uniref:Uncharacterized protein n=2 Tax=Sorghum bicolor TaxID=4558 RepID=A0A921RIY7_SORBI|nr:hypothetical protein BDA96_03G437800 [Sorghum bicolor]OQU88122.1 hypothetical protein SORBI_3003G406060 [Sorghum bicolor]
MRRKGGPPLAFVLSLHAPMHVAARRAPTTRRRSSRAAADGNQLPKCGAVPYPGNVAVGQQYTSRSRSEQFLHLRGTLPACTTVARRKAVSLMALHGYYVAILMKALLYTCLL